MPIVSDAVAVTWSLRYWRSSDLKHALLTTPAMLRMQMLPILLPVATCRRCPWGLGHGQIPSKPAKYEVSRDRPHNALLQQEGFQLAVLRVSSLARFYKSRFWLFSENFLKKIWIKFLKKLWTQRFSAASHSKMNENWLFCCCFQAVLLLFSNFFRCFSRILTNFRNFSKKKTENFQKFFRFFSEISEKFLKYFLKIYESRDFLLPAIQKWMKTSCFAAVFKVFS